MGRCQDEDIPRFVECLGSFQQLDATAQMAEMGVASGPSPASQQNTYPRPGTLPYTPPIPAIHAVPTKHGGNRKPGSPGVRGPNP